MILHCSVYTTWTQRLFSTIWTGWWENQKLTQIFNTKKSLINNNFFMPDFVLANLCSLCNAFMLKICFINAFYDEFCAWSDFKIFRIFRVFVLDWVALSGWKTLSDCNIISSAISTSIFVRFCESQYQQYIEKVLAEMSAYFKLNRKVYFCQTDRNLGTIPSEKF